MYKLLFSIILLIFSFTADAGHKVFMLHPTVGYIENIRELVRLKVIDIAGLEITGVYHEKEVNDYSRAEKFLKDTGLEYFHLMKISGDLNAGNIYQANDCTEAFRQIVKSADAILFNGGPDIQPSIYGEKQSLLTEVTDPYRHLMETSLFFHLIGGSRNPEFKPLLEQKPGLIVRAFCLGMQTMNVAAGGTLIQDIPNEVYNITTAEGMLELGSDNRHRNYNTQLNPGVELAWSFLHPVVLSPEGYLFKLVRDSGQISPLVLSSHHQAVGKMGSRLKVLARSMDGKIVEALQHEVYTEVIGVQFHPEVSSLYQPDAKYAYAPGIVYSLNQKLKESNSLGFHLDFWHDFSEKVNATGH